jgi:hypothetical protein
LSVEKILFQQKQNKVLTDLMDYQDDAQYDQEKLFDKDVLLREVEQLRMKFYLQ